MSEIEVANCLVWILVLCRLKFKHCMVGTYIKKIMHNIICVTGVYSREMSNTFFVGQVLKLVKNFNTGI